MKTTTKPSDWRPAFLAALRQMPVLRHACETVGIDRATAWRNRQADPEFNAAVEEAMEEGIDLAEQEAIRRGVWGWEEPVIHQGQLMHTTAPDGSVVPLTVRKHSDQILALVLKGRRKRVYADRQEITGADGAPLQVDETERAARIAAILELARSRRAQDDVSDLL